jgi:predicted permease
VGGAFGTAFRAVSDDYFVTMQIERLSGRWFNGDDRAESPRVIIVNRSLAAHAWPEQTAVGQLLYLNVEEDPNPYTVVGVADDVRQTRLSEEAFEEVYVPLSQTTQRRMDYAVRVSTDPGAALAVLQETVRSLDPDVPISRVALAADVVGNTTSDARFFASLLAVFGALGLFLGAVGVYGVMAYTVSRRTREMGIRIALGAGSDDVLKRTLLRGMVPVGVGLAIGIPSALAAAGILRGLLYQITPADPLTFLLVPVVLTGVSILALLLPARRASRIDPVRVLKGE